ncbi:protein CROWDED NUCLEI 4 isoform X2 [Manihot esculenta]|uniref:Protein CROWDED NUCLEI 4 n=1 Tax=Manihot esculenta TaxID=3983 RepID=A0A2C9UVS5_MANES|nr:protein CROWDED NUCLEI 4 isoform X2 [Manihot esculenta]OAY35651.1 hypothetical protein MANES_12G118800v8 [Manihot esculenta]
MASPVSPNTVRALSITPGARILKTPLSDETIWKRLKEAGFDEDSIKRRDKAALIAYIAKLESEIFDLQHHMGLLILERKEFASKYEQIKASAEAAELKQKHDQAVHLLALAEARKREESLKKSLGVEKECLKSIEKALHEMRAESAESKVAADCKLADARSMVEDAQNKYMDAEAKMRAAEALQAEANQHRRAAERKLQEVEAREDDLRRRINTFKADCDAKEKEIVLERQSLSERRKVLQQEHERLLDGQALLNQREEYVANKSQDLDRLEKELQASKTGIEKELRDLNDKKSNLELTLASLSQREAAVIEREALISKREQQLLVSQEKLASRESVEIQKVIADHETILKTRKSVFEAELEMNRKLVEDEIEAKRRAWELRELDLRRREDMLNEREHELEVKSRMLAEEEKDVAEKMNFLDEKERGLNAAERDSELRSALLQQEKEDINKIKLELQESLNSLEDKKNQVDCAKEKVETMKCETNELSVLVMKLKEEVDMVRAQKLELMAEEDRLKVEKAKFETEWELIDEKREELRMEAERIVEERQAVSRLLKDERESLRLEKERIREQHTRDVESLNHEREEFMNKMVYEHSEWFNKIQKEHSDFLLGIEMQKRELENSIEKRREEIEDYLRDQEKAFEIEKKNELEHVSYLREKAAKELEQVALEMKKLESERTEINLDREQRDKEWAVLNKYIEELKDQTQKLEKQRELLRTEREEICAQVEHLKKLEDLKLMLDNMEVAKIQQSNMESSLQKISAVRHLRNHSSVKDAGLVSHEREDVTNNGNRLDSPSMQKSVVDSSPNSARFSWIKRCTEMIFKSSPEKPLLRSEEKSLISNDAAFLASAGKLDSSNSYHGEKFNSEESSGKRQSMIYAFGEPKVISEPPEDEIAKGKCEKESETKKDANEDIDPSFSEQAIHAGRKRRSEKSSLYVTTDPQPEQRQNNKRRRQQKGAAVNLSKDAKNPCVTSTKINATEEDKHSTEEGAEDDVEVIAERIIKISEVTSEVTCDYGDVHDGGRNGHSNQKGVEHSAVPCEFEVSVILKDQMGHVGHGTGQHQSGEDEDASKTSDLRVDISDVARSDNSEKFAEDVGRRTRSKQKL